MNPVNFKTVSRLLGFVLLITLSMSPIFSYAHCDTMDGPVIADARMALEKADITPVLKWVKSDFEGEIRQAFDKTIIVRKQSPAARELADMYFFETLVRIHRAGEGAPYTGLKPAGSELLPAVVEADKAIASGDIGLLLSQLTEEIQHSIHLRFEKVMEAKKHMNDSVEAGREYVEAYVIFVHFVENLALTTGASEHHGEPAPEAEHHH